MRLPWARSELAGSTHEDIQSFFRHLGSPDAPFSKSLLCAHEFRPDPVHAVQGRVSRSRRAITGWLFPTMSELRSGAVLRRGLAAPLHQARDAQCAKGAQGAARGRSGEAPDAGRSGCTIEIVRRSQAHGCPIGIAARHEKPQRDDAALGCFAQNMNCSSNGGFIAVNCAIACELVHISWGKRTILAGSGNIVGLFEHSDSSR